MPRCRSIHILPLLILVFLIQMPSGYSQMKIMPLGNSITQGLHIDWRPGYYARLNSYRRPLWFKLQTAGVSVDFIGSLTETDNSSGLSTPDPDFDLDHEGHSGWRVDELLYGQWGGPGLSSWVTMNVPDAVLLHVGTNDLIQEETVLSTWREIGQVLDTLQKYNPNVHIYLAKIMGVGNYVGPAPGVIAAQFDSLNSIIPDLLPGRNTPTSPITIVDIDAVIDPDVETVEGIHPDSLGEIDIAQAWFDAIVGSTFPVEILDFSAETDGNSAVLEWATATETNNSGFEVQMLEADGNFEQLGFVAGNGTTSDVSEYEFRTRKLEPGSHVFRLRQVDLDGKFAYSDRASVEIRTVQDNPIRMYPNPASDQATIEINTDDQTEVSIHLFDIQGAEHKINAQKVGGIQSQIWELNTTTLLPGLYIVKVWENGHVYADKLIISK